MPRHHASASVAAVEDLFGSGLSDYEISRRTRTSRSTVQRWRTHGRPRRHHSYPLPTWRPPHPETYSYLLGVYLGDGYISKVSRSPVLEISLDPRYPGIVDECMEAIRETLGIEPRKTARRSGSGESIRVVAGSQLWPAVFPQHGNGKKHKRSIALTSWQQEIVDQCPQKFLRGLIHSDGSRSLNRVVVDLACGPREYTYPRYFFTNLSDDIRGLFCTACDQIGVKWTRSSYKNISIANRQSVEILDSFIGPKT